MLGAFVDTEPALAAPCPPGPNRASFEPWIRDRSVLSSDSTPLKDFKGPLPVLHRYEVSLVGDIDNTSLTPPAGCPSDATGRP